MIRHMIVFFLYTTFLVNVATALHNKAFASNVPFKKAGVQIRDLSLSFLDESGKGESKKLELSLSSQQNWPGPFELVKEESHLELTFSPQNKARVIWPNYLSRLKNFSIKKANVDSAQGTFSLELDQYQQQNPKKKLWIEGITAKCMQPTPEGDSFPHYLEDLLQKCLADGEIKIESYKSERKVKAGIFRDKEKTKTGKVSNIFVDMKKGKFELSLHSQTFGSLIHIAGKAQFHPEEKILQVKIDQAKLGSWGVRPLLLYRMKKWDKPYSQMQDDTLFLYLSKI